MLCRAVSGIGSKATAAQSKSIHGARGGTSLQAAELLGNSAAMTTLHNITSTHQTTMSPPPPRSRPTVRTRVLVLSDTHTQPPKEASAKEYAYREPLPDADLLLHAGDITKVGYLQEYKPMVDMIKRHPAELKLVIAGNHDITLDPQYYRSEYGRRRHINQDLDAIRDLWCGDEAKAHGIVYLEEGTRSFDLKNGARFTVYSSPYQPEFCNWAFAYPRSEDRYNPTSQVSQLLHPTRPAPTNPVPDHPGVDIMLTHGPPVNILDATWRGEKVGCEHLLRAARRARPLLHCFGHIHEGWGAARMDWVKSDLQSVDIDPVVVRDQRHTYIDMSDRSKEDPMDTSPGEAGSSNSARPLKWGAETMFVNASIMNVRYRPTNAPWILDLDLPAHMPNAADT